MKAKKRAFTQAHLINVSRGGIWIYTDAQVLEIRCELPEGESACDAQAEMDGAEIRGAAAVLGATISG